MRNWTLVTTVTYVLVKSELQHPPGPKSCSNAPSLACFKGMEQESILLFVIKQSLQTLLNTRETESSSVTHSLSARLQRKHNLFLSNRVLPQYLPLFSPHGKDKHVNMEWRLCVQVPQPGCLVVKFPTLQQGQVIKYPGGGGFVDALIR